MLAADKVLIVGVFNIYVDNEKYAFGSAFLDVLNSIGVRQHMSGPTHCQNHSLDLILSHCHDSMPEGTQEMQRSIKQSFNEQTQEKIHNRNEE